MAKNDWQSGDPLTRSRMNQPMFLQSGLVSGNDVQLWISPGWIRFPGHPAPVGSIGAQTFTIANAHVATFYNVFVRSDGTFMVSGSTGIATPPPPRWDAEYLGKIYTGVSLSTNNLQGPWTSGLYELRGQQSAITATRPRAVYDVRDSGAGQSLGSLDPNIVASSGLSYLSFNNFNAKSAGQALIQATVRWVPSGKTSLVDVSEGDGTFPESIGRWSPAFAIQRGVATLGVLRTTAQFVQNQDPDSVSGYMYSPMSTSFTAVDTVPSGAGYNLFCAPDSAIRIEAISFVALIGLTASNVTEPD